VKRLQSQQLILQLYYILLCHSNKFWLRYWSI
jgi:hypothetical protein